MSTPPDYQITYYSTTTLLFSVRFYPPPLLPKRSGNCLKVSTLPLRTMSAGLRYGGLGARFQIVEECSTDERNGQVEGDGQ